MGRSNVSFLLKKHYYEKIKKLKNYKKFSFLTLYNIKLKCGYSVKSLKKIYEKNKIIE